MKFLPYLFWIEQDSCYVDMQHTCYMFPRAHFLYTFGWLKLPSAV